MEKSLFTKLTLISLKPDSPLNTDDLLGRHFSRDCRSCLISKHEYSTSAALALSSACASVLSSCVLVSVNLRAVCFLRCIIPCPTFNPFTVLGARPRTSPLLKIIGRPVGGSLRTCECLFPLPRKHEGQRSQLAPLWLGVFLASVTALNAVSTGPGLTFLSSHVLQQLCLSPLSTCSVVLCSFARCWQISAENFYCSRVIKDIPNCPLGRHQWGSQLIPVSSCDCKTNL